MDKVTQEGAAATTPIAAVGVRTSGSYLAPIVAASLRSRGVSGRCGADSVRANPFQRVIAQLCVTSRGGAAWCCWWTIRR